MWNLLTFRRHQLNHLSRELLHDWERPCDGKEIKVCLGEGFRPQLMTPEGAARFGEQQHWLETQRIRQQMEREQWHGDPQP